MFSLVYYYVSLYNHPISNMFAQKKSEIKCLRHTEVIVTLFLTIPGTIKVYFITVKKDLDT